MMTVETRYGLLFAAEKANDLFELLKPACDAMSVAGSIRRRRRLFCVMGNPSKQLPASSTSI